MDAVGTADPVIRRVIVSGRVQGVGYRAWCLGEARRLGLVGWVRNRSDGTVEWLATGPAAAVEAFVARCRKGPFLARVTDIRVTDISLDEVPADTAVPDGFEKRPTV